MESANLQAHTTIPSRQIKNTRTDNKPLTITMDEEHSELRKKITIQHGLVAGEEALTKWYDEIGIVQPSADLLDDKLVQFLVQKCRELMPKWIFESNKEESHWTVGKASSISHGGRIDAGASGHVEKVQFFPVSIPEALLTCNTRCTTMKLIR